MERLHERLNLGAALIALADDEDVDVRGGLVLHEEGVARRHEIRLHCPVRVDDGDVDIVERARKLRCLDLLEDELLRIVDDILHGCGSADAVLELQQTCALEEEQGASAVGRVARDGDLCAVLHFVDVLDLVRVYAHRLDMDAEDVRELQLGMLGDEVLEVRLMLEEVRVDFLVVRREVRLHVVVELDDFEFDAFLLKLGLYDLEDFSVGNGGGADLENLLRFRGSVVRTAAAADEGERGEREDEGE